MKLIKKPKKDKIDYQQFVVVELKWLKKPKLPFWFFKIKK